MGEFTLDKSTVDSKEVLGAEMPATVYFLGALLIVFVIVLLKNRHK